MSFSVTNASLARALQQRGYSEPTPVQASVLESHAIGRDLLVSAQTGSGKTVAYGLALAATLIGEEERLPAPGAPLALIIAPTRELAVQVQQELTWLYAAAGGRVCASIGGMDARREARALDEGCHIVVGTPGRLRDHLERGRLDLHGLRAVVLDEADEMLDLGFREDIEFILDATPAERRTLLFSATIPRDIAALARRYQRDALRIDKIDNAQPHGDIEYRALRIAPNETEHAVVNVLRYFDARAALIFCQTREAVRHLHASLVERGFAAVALSGELTQGERTHALQALRDGRARVCVATDVAARGIDLPGLDLVIHAELPNDRDTLLHRSGRTGRAGRKGVCVILAPYTRGRKADALIQQARVDVLWEDPPSASQIHIADQKRLLEDPVFSDAGSEEDAALAQKLLAERKPEEIAGALARLFRARLPAPEDVFEAGQGAGQGTGPARRPRAARQARPGGAQAAWAHCGLRRGPRPGGPLVPPPRRSDGLVPHERRPQQQRRSEMDPARDLPAGPRDETGHRRHPDLRAGNQVRDRGGGRRQVRLRGAPHLRRKRPYPARGELIAGGDRPAGRPAAGQAEAGQRRVQKRAPRSRRTRLRGEGATPSGPYSIMGRGRLRPVALGGELAQFVQRVGQAALQRVDRAPLRGDDFVELRNDRVLMGQSNLDLIKPSGVIAR
jgi:ATP-dependent RNA helicase DeaD